MLAYRSDSVRGKGVLYIVATPIGNLDDFGKRAESTLRRVDYIAAEDTRHTLCLLRKFHIEAKLFSVRDCNERIKAKYIASLLEAGKSVALVCDAGTPLISDPGYYIVRFLRKRNLAVTPIPGTCALISALCASGLPTNQFFFGGFLPAKSKARRNLFEAWKTQLGTIVFYESTHRIYDSVTDIQTVYGQNIELVLAREVTKAFETFLAGTPNEILTLLDENRNQLRGEFVVMLAPNRANLSSSKKKVERILQTLLETLSVRQSIEIGEKLTGEPRNYLYKLALEIRKD